MNEAARHLLIVGHPGHELRCFGWLVRHRPTVCILTDGSGLQDRSRVPSSDQVLRIAGAEPGPVYGRMTDIQVYETTMAQEHGVYCKIVDDLVAWFNYHQPLTVVGDAAEGRESTHDICRLLIGAATQIYTRQTSARVNLYDFPLFGLPDSNRGSTTGGVQLTLSQDEFERKVAATLGYKELQEEIRETYETFGRDVFRHEYLRPVEPSEAFDGPVGDPPYYESYALEKVERGEFEQALVYDPHILSLTNALREHVRRSSP